MEGSMIGNVVGISYFFLYQILGVLFAGLFLKKERKEFQLLIGSITGSVALHWLPTLTSLVMGFTVLSHCVGLGIFILLFVVVMFLKKPKQVVFGENQKGDGVSASIKAFGLEIKEAPVYWILMGVTFLFFVVLLMSHTIVQGSNGEIRTGQCTYGDMNMHLGFITSIANQKNFPPDYSILPGVKLAYPFLCDSISSSVYVFGSSLRIAYILPMLIAILQVFLGFYCLGKVVLKDKIKSLVAWVCFFFNGGFGFIYFLDMVMNNKENFTRIFSGFYTTPTNLVDNNVRWSNVIVDMLLPQRATLFGWAVLFGTLALLYRAMEKKKVRYFVLVAVFGGALPLIHTHSFLALAMVCVVWVTGYMYEMAGGNMEPQNRIAKYLVPGGLVLMSLLQICTPFKNHIKKTGFAMVGLIVLVAVVVIVYYLYKVCKQGKWKELFQTWGVLLCIVLVLALPQLFNWTFQQVGSGESLRGSFNWANEQDQYIWFYIKNIGLTALVAIPALIYAKKRKFFMAAPALLIWSIAEFMVFQPNVYDNNKLLYVGYMLLLFLCADFLVDIFKHIYSYKKLGAICCAIVVIAVCTTSGILTMGREYVSGEEYELYSADQVSLCDYIEKNVKADAVILTNCRHNNAVASLTGRNIVCGAGTFLYYHGLNYQEREAQVGQMYTTPLQCQNLFDEYNVSYVLIGPDERSSFSVDEASIQSMGECVFSQNDVQLYKIK